MTRNVALTQQKYSEEWVVVVDREQFILNELEIQILKEADKNGIRGIVWFDKFAVSIPHIKSIYLRSRKPKGEPEELYEFIDGKAVRK
jgi:hypothetical protein